MSHASSMMQHQAAEPLRHMLLHACSSYALHSDPRKDQSRQKVPYILILTKGGLLCSRFPRTLLDPATPRAAHP